MQPWEMIASTHAPDGTLLELRRRGSEFRIWAGGFELMSNEDAGSSRALSELGCKHLSSTSAPKILIGGLGMGFTLRAALDCTGPQSSVEVAELVPAVGEWNRTVLAELAGRPLDDPRTLLRIEDVRVPIFSARSAYDAILLDVDNGPSALAHAKNDGLYSRRGLANALIALRPGGVLGVWSIQDDTQFTRRLEQQGFVAELHRVEGSRKGRGRHHWIWIAQKPHKSRGKPA
jgi:spermidine synthase